MNNQLRIGAGLTALVVGLFLAHRHRAVLRKRLSPGVPDRLRRAAGHCYRTECETVYDQQEMTRQVPVWETETRERRYKVLKPVTETSMREERFTVQRPVRETVMRDCSYDHVRTITETAEREERYIVHGPCGRRASARSATP